MVEKKLMVPKFLHTLLELRLILLAFRGLSEEVQEALEGSKQQHPDSEGLPLPRCVRRMMAMAIQGGQLQTAQTVLTKAREVAADLDEKSEDFHRRLWMRMDADPVFLSPFKAAASVGSVEALQWMYGDREVRETAPEGAFAVGFFAASQCHVNCLRWVARCPKGGLKGEGSVWRAAARSGSLDCLRFLFQHSEERGMRPLWGVSVTEAAISNGHFECLRWLVSQSPPCPWTESPTKSLVELELDLAEVSALEERGEVRELPDLHTGRMSEPKFRQECAARIVELATQKGDCGCSPLSAKVALRKGQMRLFRWLCSVGGEVVEREIAASLVRRATVAVMTVVPPDALLQSLFRFCSCDQAIELRRSTEFRRRYELLAERVAEKANWFVQRKVPLQLGPEFSCSAQSKTQGQGRQEWLQELYFCGDEQVGEYLHAAGIPTSKKQAGSEGGLGSGGGSNTVESVSMRRSDNQNDSLVESDSLPSFLNL
eukprot:Cvel_20607.t2-p1 / transcript=Cvel_20607.t2 / gene=Cvel_20607 / organism=Chromera_velia_CCMP2878 / gene_product=hypothetical protein / transcript_product=hypothetical protein / location=Cvel_scaffold1864:27577-29031(-) / protein_length=485 / sequence_SO=supercontig / SO=protein_coding / is_pseudo=false